MTLYMSLSTFSSLSVCLCLLLSLPSGHHQTPAPHQPGQTGSHPPDFVHIIHAFNTCCTWSSEYTNSLCVLLTSSMSGWPCHNDAASYCPFVFPPDVERRAPSVGGSGTWSADLEEAEKKGTGQKWISVTLCSILVLNPASQIHFMNTAKGFIRCLWVNMWKDNNRSRACANVWRLARWLQIYLYRHLVHETILNRLFLNHLRVNICVHAYVLKPDRCYFS